MWLTNKLDFLFQELNNKKSLVSVEFLSIVVLRLLTQRSSFCSVSLPLITLLPVASPPRTDSLSFYILDPVASLPHFTSTSEPLRALNRVLVCNLSLVSQFVHLCVFICLCMRVNVRRSPPRRAEGIKLLRLRVAPSAVQTLIKYTIPVSGLDGLVEEKKEDGGQREKERDTGKRAGRPCLTR